LSLPNLIHPITVTISPLDRTATVMDPDAREPISSQASYGATVTVQAQIMWGGGGHDKDTPEYQEAGVRKRSGGYILVRFVDISALGYTPKRGDRITSLGANQTALDLYITESHPMAHYPDQSGPSLLKLFFEDRSPVKQIGLL